MEGREAVERRLLEAARSLCHESGLSALTFRGIARKAGMSAGGLAGRHASLDALLASIAEAEVRDMAAWLGGWRLRLPLGQTTDDAMVAQAIEALLDDWARNRCGSAHLQAALRVSAPLLPAALRTSLAEIDRVLEQFLAALSQGHPASPGGLAAVLHAMLVDELAFTLCMGDLPAYRWLRWRCLRHLLAGLPPSDPPELPALLAELEALSITAEADGKPAEGVGGLVADSIADLLEEGNLGAISHRKVAARLGMAHTSVAHHFPTAAALMRAGLTALYRRIRSGARNDVALAERVARASHGLALAAARDPFFRPYAIDMRWRRGENLWPLLPAMMGDGSAPGSHRLNAQLISLTFLGACLSADGLQPDRLQRLRQALDTIRRAMPSVHPS
ncbi:TetR/AcrR family transcriptional regulator [Thermaurantiacus tibetensis]|uniref:TetR/AcrR family transcriptional regulator n=1 Tax=Thermaurantiacus tibetensis TaxID=2759035 RepID=UPI00188F9BD7|nr:TetR/AcrR family transcriptional regulator [Thermaurantiacus tibetensis]